MLDTTHYHNPPEPEAHIQVIKLAICSEWLNHFLKGKRLLFSDSCHPQDPCQVTAIQIERIGVILGASSYDLLTTCQNEREFFHFRPRNRELCLYIQVYKLAHHTSRGHYLQLILDHEKIEQPFQTYNPYMDP